MWRIAALLATLLPLAGFMSDWFLYTVLRPLDVSRLNNVQLPGVMFVYAVAPIFLMVESFRSLSYLDQTVYETTWAANAPYIS